MRVHLPRLERGRFTDLPVVAFEELATRSRFKRHQLTSIPGEADLILFPQCHMVDWRLTEIRNHPTALSCWDRVCVYDERDRPWRSFPGVYVSSSMADFDPERQAAWGYARIPGPSPSDRKPDLLFSFRGSRTAPCRDRVLQLRHPDAIVEGVDGFMFWDTDATGHAERRARFCELIERSRFVLCPRGRGTSSIRLYEVLAAGRVPVIIADDWVAPAGPDWSACSIRVSERDIDEIATVLEGQEDWQSMAEAAQATYVEFFAPDVAFDRIVDLCGNLLGSVTAEPRSRLAARSLRAALGERRRELAARATRALRRTG